jgi:predicted component of type VI protein secretion system
MILEVHVKDVLSGTTETLRFDKSPVRIGRNQLNDIPLIDQFVSEWHGIIRFDAQGVAYFDMGSTNGSVVDGKRVVKNVPSVLTPQSRIILGMREISVTPPAVQLARSDTGGGHNKTIGWGEPVFALPATGPAPPLQIRGGRASGAALVPAMPVGSATSEPRSEGARPAEPGSAREAKLLAAFCEAFVGLRKGFEQFGAEVGVRTVSGTTPLHRARTNQELLSYLLDPSVDPESAARDLTGIFADFGIHHIAMMEGITEGVRAVLQSLDPRAFDLDVGGGLFSGSRKHKGQWKAYIDRFDQLLTEDEELHAAIFSNDFARAYASVTLGGPRDDTERDERDQRDERDER